MGQWGVGLERGEEGVKTWRLFPAEGIACLSALGDPMLVAFGRAKRISENLDMYTCR